MYSCYGCSEKFNSSNLIKHLRLDCSLLPKGSREFRCGENKCYRYFSTAVTLRRHLLKSHTPHLKKKTVNIEKNNRKIFSPVETCINLDAENTIDVVASTSSNAEYTTHDQPKIENFEHNISSLISSLYANPLLPRSTVQFIIQEFQKFLTQSKDTLINNFYQSITEETITDNVKSALCNTLTTYCNSLINFHSDYKCIQYFELCETYIAPKEIVIGKRLEQKRTQIGLNLVSVPSTMQIIPIAKVLENFFSLPNILKDSLDYIKNLKKYNEPIINIIQGEVWKKMENANHLNLPIIVYFDDFEINNPLGSHASIHKLGAVYLSLPFLPGHYVSLLNNIFLLALCHSSDRIEFGNKIIFQKVIDQLNYLHNVGVSVCTDAFTGIIKLHVVCLTGDNLGLNGILGFVESFVSNYCCRICSANKQQVQNLYHEDISLLRNEENYESQLLVDDSSKTGIKERCVWLGLDGFDIFEHVAVDILHDFLEGCCNYVMIYVLNYLVLESKLVPFNILQSKIINFDYGSDSSSKPINAIKLEGSNLKIKTSASEMLTLTRYFGLIVGYYVPRENEVWDLYILLRKILDILLNRRIYMDAIEQLKYLIMSLNESYSKLAKTTLKPKFHFLLHYPQMMLKFGPLTQIWTMRFEARHRISKMIARTSSSRVNICKTIAIRNQLILNNMFFKKDSLISFSTGKKLVVPYEMSKQIREKFNISESNVFYSVKWFKKNGFMLHLSSVITVDICLEAYMPLLAQIQDIFVSSNEDVFLSCLYFDCIGFDDHFYAYHVRKSTTSCWVHYEDLFSPVPNTLSVMSDLKLYVTLRAPID